MVSPDVGPRDRKTEACGGMWLDGGKPGNIQGDMCDGDPRVIGDITTVHTEVLRRSYKRPYRMPRQPGKVRVDKNGEVDGAE